MSMGSKGQITGQHGNWLEGSGMITGSLRAFDPLCFSILVWPGIGEGHLPNGWWHSLQEPPRMADHREFTSLEFGPRSVGSGGLLGQRIKRWARLSRAQIQNTSLTRLRYRNNSNPLIFYKKYNCRTAGVSRTPESSCCLRSEITIGKK